MPPSSSRPNSSGYIPLSLTGPSESEKIPRGEPGLTRSFASFVPLTNGLYSHDEDSSDEVVANPTTSRWRSYDDLHENLSQRWQRHLEWMHRFKERYILSNSGFLLIALSQVFFAFMNVSVKILNRSDTPVSPLQLVLFRMAITYLCCIAYMLCRKVPDPWIGPKGVRLLLVARGFFGFFGLFSVYYALQYLSLSDTTVLTFLAPLMTCIVCAILLKEPFTLRQGLAGVFSLFGVVLIARPTFLFGHSIHHAAASVSVAEPVSIRYILFISARAVAEVTPAQRLSAVGMSLIGVLGATGAYTTLRAIGTRSHPMHSLVSFCIQCVIASTTLMIIRGEPFVVPARWSWIALLLSIGLFGFVAQVLLTIGIQRETAGRGTMALYIQIIYAAICERIFFHTSPSLLSIIGTVIILSCAMYTAFVRESTTNSAKGEPDAVRMEYRNGAEASLEEGLMQEHRREEDASVKIEHDTT